MVDPLTADFMVAFVEECHGAGLTKEAAAELLVRCSLDNELAARPAFAAGFVEKASGFPGGLMPVVGAGQLTKGANLGRLFSGVQRAWGATRAGAAAHPILTTGALTAGGVGLPMGGMLLAEKNNPNPRHDPFLSSPNSMPLGQQAELIARGVHGPGIADYTRDRSENYRRRQELNSLVRSGHADAGHYAQLRELEKSKSRLDKTSKGYLQDLDRWQDRNERIAEKYHGKADSWSWLPKWVKSDAQRDKFRADATRAQREAILARQRREMFVGGYTSPVSSRPAPPDTRRFFHTLPN